MGLSFPLPLSALADQLFGDELYGSEGNAASVSWLLQDNREMSGMGSGQVLQSDLGPSLWTGDVSSREFYHAEARRIEAKLNAVIRSIGSFYLYDPRKPYPYEDPDGSILGASSVQINSLPDAKSMTLKGLPVGYKLTEGDYLSFDYGDGRRAFHEVAEAVTANGSGVTPAFEVSPFIRPGAAVNAAVTLIKPAMKCIVRPGTLQVQSTGNVVTTQISFSVVQKP